MRRPWLALAAPILAAAPSLALPADAPAETPAAEAPAPPEVAARRFIDLHDLSCEQYMDLDDTLRPSVVWYIAGDYKAAGRRARFFDPELVGPAGAHVWTECRKHPQANLRYVVVGYFKASKAQAEERETKSKPKARGPGHI